MELLERINGFGKIGATREEYERIEQIFEFGVRSESRFVNLFSKEKQELENLFKTLFSPLYPRASSSYCHSLSFGITRQYDGAPEGAVVDIPVYSCIHARCSNYSDAVLRIIKPNNTESCTFYAVLELNQFQYSPNILDDIVSIIGQREDPIIREPQKLPDPGKRIYSFAEVPCAGKIAEVYTKAEDLLQTSNDALDVSTAELNVLRRDSLAHENIVIRRMSKDEYWHLLKTLTK